MNLEKESNLNATLTYSLHLEDKVRNYSIDAFRLLGAISIVVLHTIDSTDFPPYLYYLLKNLTRWAVPFFFFVSGYYFEQTYRTQPEKALSKRMKNLIGIFISANLIYFFLNLYIGYPLSSTFSLGSLVAGDYFHLWFIGSMILGYLTMWFILEQKFKFNTLLSIIVSFILVVLCTGSYAKVFGLHELDIRFSRHLAAIPLLLTGYLCARYKIIGIITWPIAAFLTFFGLCLQLAEAYNLYKTIGLNPVNHDFLLGTFLFSFGIFCLSITILNKRDNLLTRLGREYSLLIYLYHPILIGSRYTNLNFLIGDYSLAWVRPIGIFALCLLLIFIIEKLLPPVFRFINGSSWK